MAFPRGDEYNQAIQNPRISFSDSVLQSCKVETTPLGLPKPYSGGFTTTYKLLNNHSNWAVRCFTREISDLNRRYQSIGNFQSKNKCDFLVEANYLQNGIKVNGIFHPIIKMKWLEGEPLSIYLDKVYNQKSKIDNLILEFLKLINQLENLGIAHGDLQHGNILVMNDKLYLIDYDGMYFPDLANLKVNELGHPNFQHPKRSPNDYNKTIDRFSAIVIYTALKAISVDPSLWKKYDNGDNILFKGVDFVNPSNSQLIRDLNAYTSLSSLSNNLSAICTWEFNKIPTLNECITKTFSPLTTSTLPSGTVRSPYTVIDGTHKGRLMEYLGQKVEVVGRISAKRYGTTVLGKPYLFLNFGIYPRQTFTIVVWSEALTELRKNGIDPDALIGKYVSITGVLSSYNQTPQIAIDYANQIQTLSGQSEVYSKLSLNPIVAQPIIPTTSLPTTTKTTKEKNILDDLYKHYPVTPTLKTPIVNTPSYKSPPPSSSGTYKSSGSTNNYKSSQSSSSKSYGNGCVYPIVVSIFVGLICAALFNPIGGFIGGAFIGGIIGLYLND